MPTEIEELKSFLAQATISSGKGPSYMTCDRMDRNNQVCARKSYVTEFTNKCAWQETIEENNNPQVFVPASGVQGRA